MSIIEKVLSLPITFLIASPSFANLDDNLFAYSLAFASLFTSLPISICVSLQSMFCTFMGTVGAISANFCYSYFLYM